MQKRADGRRKRNTAFPQLEREEEEERECEQVPSVIVLWEGSGGKERQKYKEDMEKTAICP